MGPKGNVVLISGNGTVLDDFTADQDNYVGGGSQCLSANLLSNGSVVCGENAGAVDCQAQWHDTSFEDLALWD